MLPGIGHQLEAAEFARVVKMHLASIVQNQHETIMRIQHGGRRFDAKLAGHAQMHQQVPVVVQFRHDVFGAPRQTANPAAAQRADKRCRRCSGHCPGPLHQHIADAGALQARGAQPPHHGLHFR